MCLRRGILILSALLIAVSCQPRPRTTTVSESGAVPADATYEDIVPQPFDATWSAFSDLIDARGWRADQMDKPAGRIMLSQVPVDASEGDYVVCNAGRRDTYDDHQAHMNITVTRVTSSGTRVRFDTRIDARDTSGRYSGREECKSTGLYEKGILTAIDSIIVARRQM
ncbi:MAG: hypothetical protein Kow0074_19080 [Candidatus Zixiibacteriota bacterium]